MTSISDKFGKASSSSNYAQATTVKTARSIGESVLGCYDVSSYPTDTPVFFLTYKKTTDPTSGDVSITNQVSWKALVDIDNNTLTNLTVAPGYADAGNAIGDYVEPIPTSFWETSLIDALLVSHNPDGTLKTSAVQAALNIPITTSPDWSALGTVPTLVSSNGQREFGIQFTGVDYTDRLQKNTRLKIPRTVTPLTSCGYFVKSSSQYATKSSPSGITFTGGYTFEAMIRIPSYPSTGAAGLISRYDTSNGFFVEINTSGQLRGYARSGANIDDYNTTVSLPIGVWMHVAVDMNITGSPVFYIDGVAVPTTTVSNATSTINQGSGALNIGNRDSASGFTFDGYMSDVRLWSGTRTAAQIRDNMYKKLTGSESGLVGYWQLNGNFNDLTTNANNLTATNGAIATQAFSGLDNAPFNAVEYCIITTKPVYSGGNTTCKVITPSGTGIPNEVLAASGYSGMEVPFGFTANKNRWYVLMIGRTQVSTSTGATNTYYNTGGYFLSVPSGDWKLSYSGRNLTTASVNVAFLSAVAALSLTAGGSPLDYQTISEGTSMNVAMAENDANIMIPECPFNTATQVPVYLNLSVPTGSTNFTYWKGTNTPTIIKAQYAGI